MLNWKDEFKPNTLRLKDLSYLDQNFIFQYGLDLQNQPVFYVILKNDKTENDEKTIKEKFKHFVYVYESCLHILSKNKSVFKCVFLFSKIRHVFVN
jgi:hypothetical protein